MKIIDGKKIAQVITEKLRADLALRQSPLRFHCILVGNDSASLLYIKRKQQYAEDLGIGFELHQLPSGATKEQVIDLINSLNNVPDGLIVQLPLPEHLQAHTNDILAHISPERDVDGLTAHNRDAALAGTSSFLPTPIAAVWMMLCAQDFDNLLSYLPVGHKKYNLPPVYKNKTAVVVSDGDIFAATLAELLTTHGLNTTVISSFDCAFLNEPLAADVIITALGQPQFLTGDMIKKGALVIDVGTSLVDGKTVGDVEWESVSAVAGAATPVPGGVGPVTVAMLYVNLLNISQ